LKETPASRQQEPPGVVHGQHGLDPQGEMLLTGSCREQARKAVRPMHRRWPTTSARELRQLRYLLLAGLRRFRVKNPVRSDGQHGD
jgi:hypothetical protein